MWDQDSELVARVALAEIEPGDAGLVLTGVILLVPLAPDVEDGCPDHVRERSPDPLQPHRDLWRTYSDTDIHNVTAFLVTLK